MTRKRGKGVENPRLGFSIRRKPSIFLVNVKLPDHPVNGPAVVLYMPVSLLLCFAKCVTAGWVSGSRKRTAQDDEVFAVALRKVPDRGTKTIKNVKK